MIGTSTSATIAGTARAASSLLTVIRTISLPASCRARTCATVPATSAVSVLVMDCTTMGWALPTGTPPTRTVTVSRRVATGRNIASAPQGAARHRLEDLVLQHHADLQRRDQALAGDGRGAAVRPGRGDAHLDDVIGEACVDARAEVTRDHHGDVLRARNGCRGNVQGRGSGERPGLV